MIDCKCRDVTHLHGRTAQEYLKHLAEIKINLEEWETLYQCPITHLYWKKYYPHSEAQGGGSPELVRLTYEEARKEFDL